jgi:ATP-dependent DNA helicase RecG
MLGAISRCGIFARSEALVKMSTAGRNVECHREFNETTLRSIVAYANTSGGRVYVGIDEFGRTYGVKNAQEIVERIRSLTREQIRPDASAYVECRIENRSGRDVVVATVLRGSSRPYWLVSKGLCPSGALVSEDGQIVVPSERKFRAMLEESGSGSFERARSRVQNLTFEQALRVFNDKKLRLTEPRLYELGIVDSEGTNTNLALLLSDQCPATIRFATYSGVRENQLLDRLEFSGSILRQFQEAFEFLDVPSEIFREALLNAVIHRNYRTGDFTLLRRYSDRVEIVSPGGLPRDLTLSDLDLGVCAPRNPRLARIFDLLDYTESCGSGMRKIREAYAESETPPEFEATANYFRITLFNPPRARREAEISAKQVIEILPSEIEEKSASVAQHDAKTETPRSRRTTTIRDAMTVESPILSPPTASIRVEKLLSDRERRALRILEARETMTRADLEHELQVAPAAAAAILRRLVSAGRVVLCGAGSNIWYRLP